MQRREFLLGSLGAAAVLGTAGLPRLVNAQGRPFTFTSWGGALSDAERNAFTDPFAKLKGIEIINTSPTETAKIKAMVEGRNVEWDLVCVGGRQVFQGADEGFLEALDYSRIPNAANLEAGWRAPHGVATSTGATIIAWSSDAFPDGGPQTWADFWDVKTFPGPRGLYKYFYYNYEAAVLAAGLKREEVFPATKEKIEIAFAKLAELKPHVAVWWGAGAQPPQLLSTGELAASSAWSGRMLAAEAEGAPVGHTYNDGIAWANWWVIPKGSPYVELAHELIDYALGTQQQAGLLDLKTYGPVLGAATEGADEETRKILVMSPDNIKNMVILNEQEANVYFASEEERWNQFMLG